MKKKILSLILALVMIFSAFLPAVELLPAVESSALAAWQNANIAPVQVGTLGELVFAMENSVAGQTITLTNNIDSTNKYDWQMDISADGILVLDLNGYDIKLDSEQTAVLFNITKATDFHIIDTKAKVSDLGSISFSSKVKGKEISVIAVDNKDAKLNLHKYITIFLKPSSGDATLPEKSSIIRFGAFKQFNNYGTNLNSTIDNTLGVAFYPERANSYKDSDFGWYKGNIVTDGNCFDFSQKVAIGTERINPDFIRFGNIEMTPGTNSTHNDYAMKVYDTSSIPVKQFFIMDPIKMSVNVGGTNVSDDYTLGQISGKEKVIFRINDNQCAHTDYNDILSNTAGHIKVCADCGNDYKFEDHSGSIITTYIEPDENNSGRTSGVKCSTEGCSYNRSVYLPKISSPVVSGTIIQVEDYDELQNAFLTAKANDIIKLKKDISFNDLYDTYSANNAVLRPQARGRLVLDLNGHNITANSANTKYLIDLSMFDPATGATSLYVVNSVVDSDAQILFGEVYYDDTALVNLDNNAAGLIIADNVKLVISSSKNVSGTSVIYARRFRELRIYNGQLKNSLSSGVGIMFRPGSYAEYANSSFSIDVAKIEAPDACLDSTIYKYKEFKIGYADLIANPGKRAIKAIDTDNAKLSDILRSGYYLIPTVDNSEYLRDISNNFVYVRASANCKHAETAPVLTCDSIHRVYCTSCHLYDYGKHDLKLAAGGVSPDCSNPGYKIYACECGYSEKINIDPTGNHYGNIVQAKAATCDKPGVRENYFKCEKCEKYFLSATKEEISLERLIIHPHGSTLITDPRTGLPRITLKREATCTLEGIKESYYTCKICNVWVTAKGAELDKVENTLPKADHNYKLHKKQDATCTADGARYDYYTCDVCDGIFSDSKAQISEMTFKTDIRIPKREHKFTVYTKKGATCTEDGYKETFKICENCNEVHKDSGNLAGDEAMEFFFDAVIPKGHKLQKEKAEKATCTKNGSIEHYKCSTCSKLFSDSAAKKEITDITAYAPGHNYNWVVTRPAEVGVEGEKANKCTVCGDIKETQKLDALEPEYLIGDVNDDGKWTAADARLALRRSVELDLDKFTEKMFKAADTDKNGKITAADARKILRVSVELETF